VCLSSWGSYDWGSHSRGGAWLHEGQSNSQYNCEDYQEYIKGWLTLATPTNCEENSEEDTQTSQQHLKVNVHFYNLQRFIFHSDLFYNLQPCFNLFVNFILNLKFFPIHVLVIICLCRKIRKFMISGFKQQIHRFICPNIS
jgi:hypothetical protein